MATASPPPHRLTRITFVLETLETETENVTEFRHVSALYYEDWSESSKAVDSLSYRATRATCHFLPVEGGVGQDTSALLAQRSCIEL